MAKNSINEFSTTAASNTDIGGIGVQGTNAVSNFDGAFRELMSQLADMNGGNSPIYDTMRWCDPADNTKVYRFDGVGVSTASTRVLSIPDASGTIPLLGLAQSWTAKQTFTSSSGTDFSGVNPTLNLIDTDTGADNSISANNSSGSLAFSADTNNEVASSIISFSVDGTQWATLNGSGVFSVLGSATISSANPSLTFTDTDTGADSTISANSGAGILSISADANNESANSAVVFSVDGSVRASVDGNGDWNVATWSATGASVGLTYDASEGIFRTSQNASTGKFHFAFYNTNGIIGSISTSGTTTTFSTSSDYRRKNSITGLDGFWDRLNAVTPRSFIWDSGQADTGFIAHEFAEIYPAAVIGEKDAIDADGNPVYQSMQASTAQVIADIIAALQDIDNRLSNIGA